MKKIKEILHAKRTETEEHIRQLEREGREGVRYTAMMPDLTFLVLALISDIGWGIHLIAGAVYFCNNGFRHVLDWLALLALAFIALGVAYIIYLNKIHEKEIATRLQKNLSSGLIAYAGLAGGMIGIIQIVVYAGIPSTVILMTAGGFINFAAGLPIYLSFKKGILYGVQ